MVDEQDRLRELVVALDARLRAFSQHEIRYYVEPMFVNYRISVLMLIPGIDKAMLMSVVIGVEQLNMPSFPLDRVVHTYIQHWIEKMKVERKYEDLYVEFNAPPSWAKVVE